MKSADFLRHIVVPALAAALVVVAGFVAIRYFQGRDMQKDAVFRTLDNHLELVDYDIVIGDREVPTKLFIYLSYTCPHCRRFFDNAYDSLHNQYVATGELAVVLRPMCAKEHLAANRALGLAVCLASFGDFSHLHKLLLADFQAIFTQEFSNLVDDLCERDANVGQCLLCGEAQSHLDALRDSYKRHGFSGTPVFVIGNSAQVGHRYYKDLESFIEYNTSKP